MCCGGCICGGSGCSALDMCFSNILSVFERLAACCAFTAVVTCIVVTLLVMLGMGVGLGYNYCFVHIKTNISVPDGTEKGDNDLNITSPTQMTPISSSPGSVPDVTNPDNDATPDSLITTAPTFLLRRQESSNRIKTTKLYFLPKTTIIMPLYTDLDLLGIIKKFREERRNLTIELISL